MIANMVQLAELQGVSRQEVRSWLEDGCPFERRGKKGRDWQFDPARVTAWRIERESTGRIPSTDDESEAAAKRRKLIAEADIREMKAAEQRGELCKEADLFTNLTSLKPLSAVQRLGRVLSRAQGRVFGGLRLVRTGKNPARYQVIPEKRQGVGDSAYV